MTVLTQHHDTHVPVDYNDAEHKYFLGTVRYTSATQLVEQFIPPFDVEERSMYMADRYGNTPLYWKTKWKRENSNSIKRGNFIHNDQEMNLYKERFIRYNGIDTCVYNMEHFPSRPLITLPDGIYPEMKLWRHDCRIAGRSDKVIITSDLVDKLLRTADVEDYKTNKKIYKYGFQNRDGSSAKLLGPLSHVEDAEYWHYSLQLSVYQYMLEYHGFIPGTRKIIHFPHPTDEFPDPLPVVYDLPYMRNEVIEMIKHNRYVA